MAVSSNMAMVCLNKELPPFLNLPVEIRLEIYSYLLPNTHSYTNGICDPTAVSQASLRTDSAPCRPAIVFTCKKIYHEAIALLYHKRCFNFDIAGHLLRSVTNRFPYITPVNFGAWLGMSVYFKQHWPMYDIDNLDYTRLEEVCITFWPVHGNRADLDDARSVAVDLCKRFRKASNLRKVSVKFRDGWPTPRKTVGTLDCETGTEVEYLLEPFDILTGIERVEIVPPASCRTGSKLEKLGSQTT